MARLHRAQPALGLLVALLAGCAGAGVPRPAPPPAAGAAPGSAAPTAERRLFRIGYQGPQGSGSLRLALVVIDRERYQARASDSFGRAVWSLDLAGATATLVDHRRQRHCVGQQETRLPELALGSLPLARLPDVLAGDLPADPRSAREDPADFVDDAGRRWTARREDGRLAAWTLWSDGLPLLWWRRQEEGGILSHRDGAQFRWRRSLREPLAAPPPAVAVPDDYPRVDCAELVAG